MDRDGDLDIVCGNAYTRGNMIYRNNWGMISPIPAWNSVPLSTNALILGDIDRNGFMDIVCGNRTRNAACLNLWGTLDTIPSWLSEQSNYTNSVTLGDIDGDSDLDLVCGNSTSNILYLNEGGMFRTTPDWISLPTDRTYCIDLGDMDGDDDLDLVCAVNGSEIVIHQNEGGTFTDRPVWTMLKNRDGNDIALGDIDMDGDLDLVCGNYYGVSDKCNTMFASSRFPVFKGDPLNPANQLPNNSTYLRYVRAKSIGDNLYQIYFTAFDVESDPMWIFPDFHYVGDPVYYQANVDGQFGKAGPFASSPDGVEDSLIWDVHRIPYIDREIILRLRAISVPIRVSLVQHIAPYCLDLGFIKVNRPIITSSVSILSFPTITVGDKDSLEVLLFNSGNEVLTISGMTLPSMEMRVSSTIPFDVYPYTGNYFKVYLEPRIQTDVSGDLIIESNDPINPNVTIQIETDIRPLRVTTTMLTPEPVIPLGEAVTVSITPYPEVNIEGGYLFHRPVGSPEFLDSIPLNPFGDNHFCVIPGEAVVETGFEYYIQIENKGVIDTDPLDAPDIFYSQDVAPPVSITCRPQPTSGDEFLANRDIRVLVTLPTGSYFENGTLYFRMGGEEDFDSLALEIEDGQPLGTIPDSLVGPRGLEYWVGVNTKTRSITDPLTDPRQSPHSIQVTVQNLVEEHDRPGNRYRMVSVPLVFDERFSGTLEALLTDQKEFGVYDPVKWRCFRYIPDSLRYFELNEQDAENFFRPEPGRAFWLISAQSNRITTQPGIGRSIPTADYHAVVLEPGLNQIGNPYCFSVAWDSVTVDTFTMAEAIDAAVVESIVVWIDNDYRYGTRTIEPFSGYWVKNLRDTSVTLRVPPVEASPDTTGGDIKMLTRTFPPSATANEWRVRIRASCCEARDSYNFFGVAEGASNQRDKNDLSDPPPCPGRSISFYFPHTNWDQHSGNYSVDIRGEYQALQTGELNVAPLSEQLWGHLWRFDVTKSFSNDAIGDEVTLDFRGIESVPAAAEIYLVDRRLGSLTDLRKEQRYGFILGERETVTHEEEARFVLIAGSAGFIGEHEEEMPDTPVRTALHQNYPNPFNPSTLIRYEIARAGEIALNIYDVQGLLVKTLYRGRRDPGRYEIAWNGRNERGSSVAPGIYFYRLTASDFRQTKKMVMLR
jgi:hypothetical protein